MTSSIEAKDKIIALFKANVFGKKADVSLSNDRHDGKSGHWLERQMGITANSSNTPDLYDYEMKNDTTSKTTFGDWSPDVAIFKGKKVITRDDFLKKFGKPNLDKNGRCSWSGEPAPKINTFNRFGQKLIVDTNLNIHAVYSYSEDKRSDKSTLIPLALQVEMLKIATWSEPKLRLKLERKFNKNGWFKCLTNGSGTYTEIVFGNPMTYESWITLIKNGTVFFDSGMYQGNVRPYAMWRANNNYWDSLIVSRH